MVVALTRRAILNNIVLKLNGSMHILVPIPSIFHLFLKNELNVHPYLLINT